MTQIASHAILCHSHSSDIHNFLKILIYHFLEILINELRTPKLKKTNSTCIYFSLLKIKTKTVRVKLELKHFQQILIFFDLTPNVLKFSLQFIKMKIWTVFSGKALVNRLITKITRWKIIRPVTSQKTFVEH
jgi:hypothetical protein